MAFKMKTKQIFERHLINVNYQTKPKLIKVEAEPKHQSRMLQFNSDPLFSMLFIFYLCKSTSMANSQIGTSIVVLWILMEVFSVFRQTRQINKGE